MSVMLTGISDKHDPPSLFQQFVFGPREDHVGVGILERPLGNRWLSGREGVRGGSSKAIARPAEGSVPGILKPKQRCGGRGGIQVSGSHSCLHGVRTGLLSNLQDTISLSASQPKKDGREVDAENSPKSVEDYMRADLHACRHINWLVRR
ncbi:hypothetical protein Q8A73_006158 [Channa argus]|nr:hypothetical protein Q8A73_006158 [Channa argus]